jgi:hypothetical protein
MPQKESRAVKERGIKVMCSVRLTQEIRIISQMME